MLRRFLKQKLPAGFVLVMGLSLAPSATVARSAETIRGRHDDDNSRGDDFYCPCRLLPKPDLGDKPLTARWMAHSLEWGVLSTISSRHARGNDAAPFGNVYSFVDGPCDNATGVPYFYGTFMDQSFQDLQDHPYASLTLSEASLATVCGAGGRPLPACDAATRTGGYYGDAESPVCARLTLSGRVLPVPEGSVEFASARWALFQRHPDMEGWPKNHQWIIAKMELTEIWLIDYFGGASIVDVDTYLTTHLHGPESTTSD